MSKLIDGGDLMLFVGNGTTQKSITLSTSHTLSIESTVSDITHKDISGNWTTSEVTESSWSATSENLYCFYADAQGSAFEDLIGYWMADTELTLKFCKHSSAAIGTDGWTADSTYYTGKAYIESIEVSAPCGDNATFSVTFSGNGALTKV